MRIRPENVKMMNIQFEKDKNKINRTSDGNPLTVVGLSHRKCVQKYHNQLKQGRDRPIFRWRFSVSQQRMPYNGKNYDEAEVHDNVHEYSKDGGFE